MEESSFTNPSSIHDKSECQIIDPVISTKPFQDVFVKFNICLSKSNTNPSDKLKTTEQEVKILVSPSLPLSAAPEEEGGPIPNEIFIKDVPATFSPWAVIAVILGIFSLLLMITSGFFGYQYFQNIQQSASKMDDLTKELESLLNTLENFTGTMKKIQEDILGNLKIQIEKLFGILKLQKMNQGNYSAPCLKHRKQYKDNCYHQTLKAVSWFNCSNLCVSMNSTFLQSGNDMLVDSMKKFTLNDTWIGISYQRDSNEWKWIDGSSYPFSRTKDFPTSLRTLLLRAEISEQQASKSTVASRYSFTKRQKGSLIQMRNKYTASESLLFLRRFIAVGMGIRFFVMLAMLSTIFIYSSNPKAPSNTNGFYCGPCPKNWVCYKNICYLFSNESKSWDHSRASCLSHNASLLKIYSKEDQDFLTLVKSYHWMGLVQPTPNGFWMWEDGSPLSPDLLSLISVQKGNCAVYGSSFKGYIENCSNPNTYICMQKNHRSGKLEAPLASHPPANPIHP